MKAVGSCCLIALCFVGVGAAVAEEVTLRKVGFPQVFVEERPACGERKAVKSLLDLDYFVSVLFHGFREGTCTSIGYSRFEKAVTLDEKPLLPLPFLHHHNVTFSISTRDPNAVDVAECLGRSCKSQLSAVTSSGYVRDVAHCVGPAVGSCAPKAWACLGDDACRAALACAPVVAKNCSSDFVKVLSDPVERAKIMCIGDCHGDAKCVLLKCGRDAVDCLDGHDAVCHAALTCASSGLATCSKPASECIFGKDDTCRNNIKCIVDGARACADPAVNVLTDSSIADLVICANEKCPAPGGTPAVATFAASNTPPEHYPQQLLCMAGKCAGKVTALLADRDTAALTTCLPAALESCDGALWNCLEDAACRGKFQCWTDGLGHAGADLWRVLTDGSERQFDQDLFNCIEDCSKEQGKLQGAFCMLKTCGPKVATCFQDKACRGVLTDLPKVVASCGLASLKELMNSNSTFSLAVHCGTHVASACADAGVELIRDRNLADVVQCNAQCTRPPSELLVV